MDWVRVKRYNPSEPILCPGLIILFQLALGLGCFFTYGKDPYLYYIRANVSHLLMAAATLDCCKKNGKNKESWFAISVLGGLSNKDFFLGCSDFEGGF